MFHRDLPRHLQRRYSLAADHCFSSRPAVEEDVFAAFSVADRGYVMETGHIVREGPASVLARDPEVRRAYLGVAP
jgi:ABC-type branched-subunit amino acid transport system ATPase component